MSGEKVKTFKAFRERMNEKILEKNNKIINRFFNLDSNLCKEGALPARTKEFMALTASLVMRCDDCIFYHLNKLYEMEANDDEIFETFSMALVIGGSIAIPYIRRATAFWDDLKRDELSDDL